MVNDERLCRIADGLLYYIEHGKLSIAQRLQLIKSYEIIDRMIQAHGGSGDKMPVIISLDDGSVHIEESAVIIDDI